MACADIFKDQPTSRSASRLDNRSRTPNLFDIDETDTDLTNGYHDVTSIRPTKSFTNLFRAKSPAPVEHSPPLPRTKTQEYFSGPMTTTAEYHASHTNNDKIISPSQHQHSPQAETTITNQQSNLKSSITYSQGSTTSHSTHVRQLDPLMANDVEAITTIDTYVKPRQDTSNKPLNFSLPRAQTSSRVVMELDSYAARLMNLEDDMANLQEKMLELEQQQSLIMQAQAADPESNMYYKKTPSVLPQTLSNAYEITPPASNAGRTSNDDSAASTRRYGNSSDVDSAISSRSTSPSREHLTPIAIPLHRSDTPSLTTTSSPRQSHDSDASYFSPTAKVYRMFVDTKSDIDSLRLALDKLRADSPTKLPPLQTSTLRNQSLTPSNLKSPLHDSTTFQDPFISSVKVQQPEYTPCVFPTTASTTTSPSIDRRRSYHRQSTMQHPASRSYQHVSSTSSYHDALSATTSPGRSQSCRQQKRSSAVVGTATKARHVLGAQAIDSGMNSPERPSPLSQKRSSAVIGTATKARHVLGAQAIEVGELPVRGSSKEGGW